LGVDIDPRSPAGELGTGRQQLVEIAKALAHEAKILVLDEPTAALTDSEAESLFTILTSLRTHGIGIIYISHRLKEVFRLSDRITVLRDGRTVATEPTSHLNERQVITKMVGREVSQLFPAVDRQRSQTILEARHISAHHRSGKMLVKDLRF